MGKKETPLHYICLLNCYSSCDSKRSRCFGSFLALNVIRGLTAAQAKHEVEMMMEWSPKEKSVFVGLHHTISIKHLRNHCYIHLSTLAMKYGDMFSDISHTGILYIVLL